jgi:O-antigen ligase
VSRPSTVRTVPAWPREAGGLPDPRDVGPGQGRRVGPLEILGLVLLGANVWWVYAAGAIAGGAPGPAALLFLACAAAYVLARLGGSSFPPLVPGALVAVAAGIALLTPDLLSNAALSGPFGYANAKGAFFAQAAIAALFLALTSKAPLARLLGTASAAGFAVIPFAAGSVASAILLIALAPIALAAGTSRATRPLVFGFAALFVMVLATTVVLGVRHSIGGPSGPLGRAATTTLTERRLVLWHDALTLLRLNPGVGVGPGRFGQFSPTAQRDPDARWAHNEFLQHGAETGVVGLALFGLAFLWGFTRLFAAVGRMAVLGAAALAVLGIHASVDYVMHFPTVPIYAAALVGAGSTSARRRLRSTR